MLQKEVILTIVWLFLATAPFAGTLADGGAPSAAGSLFRMQGAVAPVTQARSDMPERTRSASLFMGRSEAGLFAVPVPGEGRSRGGAVPGGRIRFGLTGPHAELIRHVIGQAESRRHGYDAVQHAAKIRPAGRPTSLSIREIYDWIEATPGQHHAIGRYQFVPATLKRLVDDLGVHPGTRFSPALQDRLADRLLVEAGFRRFLSGTLTRHQFMNNLAKIWAGLPTSNGKSYYHGFAGNRATMTWAQFDAEMARIFPG